MATIEIKTKEKELLREIDSNAGLLDFALEYVRKLKKMGMQAPASTAVSTPCQYSVEEMKERLRKGRQAAKEGAYKPQDEMRNKPFTQTKYHY